MKLSKETIALLNNFASINQNLELKPGGVIETVAPERNIRVSAKIAEEFETPFYIYDLTTFLGVLGLLPDAELNFIQNAVELVEDGRKIRYGCAEKDILVLPSGAGSPPIAEYAKFNIDDSTISAIKKAAAIFAMPNVRISGNGKKITASVIDLKNPSSNAYDVDLGKTDKTFNADFLVSTFKMISGDYTVQLDKKFVSLWTLTDDSYVMAIAMTQTSSFS